MERFVCLNVLRHPAIPVPRGTETYEQLLDPAFHRANDDLDPVRGPAGVTAAVPGLLLDAGRPIQIRHSPAVRARKGAELFAGRLAAEHEIRVEEDPALAELEYRRDLLWTRTEHDRVSLNRRERLSRFYRPVLEPDAPAAPEGRRLILEALASLRRTLASAGPVNHLWISHGLTMPFIYLDLVAGVPPEAWTLEGVLATGPFDYACGFQSRISAGPGEFS